MDFMKGTHHYNSSYKSRHSLFILLIKSIFFCLEPPLICFSLEIAEYMSLIAISFPVIIFYFVAGQILFDLALCNNLIIICQVLLFTIIIIPMTKLLIDLKIDKIKVILIQVHAFPIFIVIAAFDILVFFIILLFMHVIYWHVRVNVLRARSREDIV